MVGDHHRPFSGLFQVFQAFGHCSCIWFYDFFKICSTVILKCFDSSYNHHSAW